MRKILLFVLIAIMIIAMGPAAFSALTSVTLDQIDQTAIKGDAAVFTISVSNDNKGTARETTFRIVEDDPSIPGNTISFNPVKIDLSRNSTVQTELTIDTTNLNPGTYRFKIEAMAPEIQGRGNSGQAESFATSGIITLTIEEGAVDPPDPPQPVDPIVDGPVTATPVEEGSLLSESELSGTFKNPEGETVSGTLDWTNGELSVEKSGNFEWTFTPENTSLYNVLTGMVEVVANPIVVEPSRVHYVALGDSMVTGTTGISGTMTSYVHGVFAYLESIHGVGNVTKTILGVDGDASWDLLNRVQSNDYYRNEIKNADIVTISIGGNNIMPAARDSSFWEINTELADAGTVNFETEYEGILAEIYELNNSVTVIASTLYNPYNSANQPRGYSGDTELHNTAKNYIDGIINKSIRSYTGGLNYHVAEVHDNFLKNYGDRGKMGEITFFYPNYNLWTWWFVRLTRDPHLNQTGQNLMLDIHINAIQQELNGSQQSANYEPAA